MGDIATSWLGPDPRTDKDPGPEQRGMVLQGFELSLGKRVVIDAHLRPAQRAGHHSAEVSENLSKHMHWLVIDNELPDPSAGSV